MTKIKRTFEIETTEKIMERLERFLALLHYNSSFGHSGLFAMPLDGDGEEKIKVYPPPRFHHEVDLCGGIGGHIEIAHNDCYTVKAIADMNSYWVVQPAAALYKDGELKRTIPSRNDYDKDPPLPQKREK